MSTYFHLCILEPNQENSFQLHQWVSCTCFWKKKIQVHFWETNHHLPWSCWHSCHMLQNLSAHNLSVMSKETLSWITLLTPKKRNFGRVLHKTLSWQHPFKLWELHFPLPHTKCLSGLLITLRTQPFSHKMLDRTVKHFGDHFIQNTWENC